MNTLHGADTSTHAPRSAGRIILLCGLPGAGKSTLARRLAAELPGVRLCPDEWLAELGFNVFDEAARGRVEARLCRHAEDLAALGVPAIMENGFWTRRERDVLRDRARDRGLRIELRHLDLPSIELHRRVALRNADPGAPQITPEMLTEYQAAFEPPTPEELALYDFPLSLTPG
jgi:hypothetical protein